VYLISVSLISLGSQTSFVFGRFEWMPSQLEAKSDCCHFAGRPAHSATISFLLSGVTLLFFSRLVSTRSSIKPNSFHNAAIPLSEPRLQLSRESSPKPLTNLRRISSVRVQKKWIVLGFAAGALALRVDLFRRWLQHTECSWSGHVVGICIFVPSLLETTC